MVCVFARETSEPLTSLVKQVNAEIAKNDALKSFVVVLTDDKTKTSKTLKEMASKGDVKNVPLTLVDDPAGPPDYKIAKDADVTVMFWKGGKVKYNYAFAKGKLSDADVKTIVADIPKLLND